MVLAGPGYASSSALHLLVLLFNLLTPEELPLDDRTSCAIAVFALIVALQEKNKKPG